MLESRHDGVSAEAPDDLVSVGRFNELVAFFVADLKIGPDESYDMIDYKMESWIDIDY